MDAQTSMFPSPYDLKAPTGAEGWEDLYPYYLKFQPALREKEDQKFWFCDSQHWPNPFKPFDAMTVEFAVKCLGQYNTRHYLVPPANGVDYHVSDWCGPGIDRGPCSAVHGSGRALFPKLANTA